MLLGVNSRITFNVFISQETYFFLKNKCNNNNNNNNNNKSNNNDNKRVYPNPRSGQRALALSG